MSYIKGYKVDFDKLRARFGTDEDNPNNTRFLPIVEIFPRDSYLYITTGRDPNDKYYLVVVPDDGGDQAELESRPMPEFDLRGAESI